MLNMNILQLLSVKRGLISLIILNARTILHVFDEDICFRGQQNLYDSMTKQQPNKHCWGEVIYCRSSNVANQTHPIRNLGCLVFFR